MRACRWSARQAPWRRALVAGFVGQQADKARAEFFGRTLAAVGKLLELLTETTFPYFGFADAEPELIGEGGGAEYRAAFPFARRAAAGNDRGLLVSQRPQEQLHSDC